MGALRLRALLAKHAARAGHAHDNVAAGDEHRLPPHLHAHDAALVLLQPRARPLLLLVLSSRLRLLVLLHCRRAALLPQPLVSRRHYQNTPLVS